MNRQLMLLFAFLVPFVLNGQEKPKNIEQFVNEIDEKIPQLLNDFLVPGAAIAIIDNGEVILQKGYGFSDIEKETKVDLKTGFNIGSISKTVAAWGVMKLVEEGKIELDAPAEKHLTRWHLPESEFDSKEVTIRRLLSHTAGLSLHGYPGWSPNDKLPTIEESLNGKNNGPGRVEIIMEPGTKYKYSGGGFTILQLIIEEVTGKKFEDYMQSEILNPLGMTNSSYKIDDKIMAASSLEYNRFGELIDFELFTAQAAAGLHTTIEDFTCFAFASLYQMENHEKYNPILSADIIRQMMEPVPEANGRFGYGLGYMVESISGTSVLLAGHRGANTGWHAIFNVNPKTNDGFIMVTNGGAGQNIYHPIFFDWALWKLGVELEDWYNAKPSIANKLKGVIDSKGVDEIAAIYAELKQHQSGKYNFTERQLNDLGYHYLEKKNMEEALAVFKLNIEAFPNAYNVYDSYGEALLIKGDKEKAIENYKKSVQLHPGNENGKKVLKELGISIDDIIVKVPTEHLKLLAGEYLMTTDQKWKIVFEVVDGELVGKDGDYKFWALPVGENEFVNTDDGASLVFDTEDENAITLLLTNKFKFRKISAHKKEDLYLLKTDSTWSKEIFHFPLSFAPEIKYEGYEDARFLPGWGKVESDEFWSYAFAWRINLNEEMSEKELQENLQKYFDGLMKVVNKDKEKVLPKTIALLQKNKDVNNNKQFAGTVQVYDAFKTKKSITLNVTIENYYCEKEKKSIILFRFSPKEFGDDVWLKLHRVKLQANVCDL